MGECLITRRSSESYVLPVLNTSYPQDKSVTFISGNTATASFSVGIKTDGKPASYTYQWYLDGSAVSDANSPNYNWSGNAAGTHYIYCAVTNKAGTVVTRTATLSVVMYYTPTLNSSYPANVSVLRANTTTTLKVSITTAGNPATYTYQWYKNGSAISGATSSTYSFSLANSAGSYTFYCKVTNSAGTVQSRTATVTLTEPWLYNNNNEYTSVTGGWQITKALASSNTSYTLGGLQKYSNGLWLNLSSTSGQDGFVGTVNKINLTNYSKIQFTVNSTYTNDSDYYTWLCATSINTTSGASNGVVASTKVSLTQDTHNTSARTYTVDISGVSGSYYVGFYSWMWDGTYHFRVDTIKLIL